MTSEPALPSEQPENTPTSPTTRGSHFSLADVRQEMDRLWESIMSGRLSRLSVLHQTPPVDVFEKEGNIRVRAELPGMSENDVQVEVEGNDLVISGEKRDEREVRDDNQYRSERTYGRFMRRISLPMMAETENATATFKNGVLEIDMPMKPGPDKKRIDVRS